MSQPDAYALLDLDEGATDAEVQRAFKRLAKDCHPDTRPGDAEAERRFKELAEARAVLLDPLRRADLNRARRRRRAQADRVASARRAAAPPRGPAPPAPRPPDDAAPDDGGDPGPRARRGPTTPVLVAAAAVALLLVLAVVGLGALGGSDDGDGPRAAEDDAPPAPAPAPAPPPTPSTPVPSTPDGGGAAPDDPAVAGELRTALDSFADRFTNGNAEVCGLTTARLWRENPDFFEPNCSGVERLPERDPRLVLDATGQGDLVAADGPGTVLEAPLDVRVERDGREIRTGQRRVRATFVREGDAWRIDALEPDLAALAGGG